MHEDREQANEESCKAIMKENCQAQVQQITVTWMEMKVAEDNCSHAKNCREVKSRAEDQAESQAQGIV